MSDAPRTVPDPGVVAGYALLAAIAVPAGLLGAGMIWLFDYWYQKRGVR